MQTSHILHATPAHAFTEQAELRWKTMWDPNSTFFIIIVINFYTYKHTCKNNKNQIWT